MVFVFVILLVILLFWLLKMSLLLNFFGDSSNGDDRKDDIHIVNEGKNDKPKINPNIGEVTDYEEIE